MMPDWDHIYFAEYLGSAMLWYVNGLVYERPHEKNTVIYYNIRFKLFKYSLLQYVIVITTLC